jgi:hypothetical protein
MVTIGVDPHKQTHTAAAVNALGVELAHRTAPDRPVGNGQLVEWARALDCERVWAVEEVRNVSGSLERFLIDRGETVVRLAVVPEHVVPRVSLPSGARWRLRAAKRSAGRRRRQAISTRWLAVRSTAHYAAKHIATDRPGDRGRGRA